MTPFAEPERTRVRPHARLAWMGRRSQVPAPRRFDGPHAGRPTSNARTAHLETPRSPIERPVAGAETSKGTGPPPQARRMPPVARLSGATDHRLRRAAHRRAATIRAAPAVNSPRGRQAAPSRRNSAVHRLSCVDFRFTIGGSLVSAMVFISSREPEELSNLGPQSCGRRLLLGRCHHRRNDRYAGDKAVMWDRYYTILM